MEIPDELLDAMQTAESFKQVADFLLDSNVTLGLSYIAKAAQQPDMPDRVMLQLIPQLQAVAAVCAVNAKAFQTIRKHEPDAANKKNLYYTLAEEFDKFVMALKKRI